MRRALLTELPALCLVYGLRPWEVEELTFAELAEFRRQLAEIRKTKGG